MPGVETGLLATLAAPKSKCGFGADDLPSQPAARDDFDSVMQATLAPATPKPSARHFSRTQKSPPSPGKLSPEDQPAKSANRKGDAAKSFAVKSDAAAAGESGDAGANGKGRLATDAPVAAVDGAESSPALFSLPFFFHPAENQPPGRNDALESVPPVNDEAAGKSITAVSTPAAAPQALTGKSESRADATTEHLPLKNLSPVAAAEMETPAAIPTDRANKAPAQTETNGPAAGATAPDADWTPEPFEISTTIASPANEAPVADPARSEIASQPSPGAGPETGAPAADAGTGVAMTDSPMKNPQKANKVAGPGMKVLPVGEGGGPHEKDLPTHWLVSVARAASNGCMDLDFSSANGNGQSATTESAPVLNAVDLPSLTDAKMRALERAHDMMALHAVRLAEAKSDTLSVVIKPAVGTELSLELRQHDGGVEAQATLTRGDREFFSQHWPELQQRLEQRGVKLAPLAGETNFSANDHGHFHRHQTSQEDAAQQASAFAEFASVAATGGATARQALVHDGWESWA